MKLRIYNMVQEQHIWLVSTGNKTNMDGEGHALIGNIIFLFQMTVI